jgi:hypothetical protein
MFQDRSTTSPILRVPVLLGLAALTAYFLACFVHAEDSRPPAWAYPGVWKMFTNVGKEHADVAAQVLVAGEWRSVDLEAMYPSRWDSGPRYVRAAFRTNKHRMRVLASSVCLRDGRGPERVRLYDVRWPVRPGAYEQPRDDEKRKLVVDWRCGDRIRLPDGVRL